MLKYIVEICVRIDIAILGIAYPIIISQISKIGDKFNSNYLPDIFRLELMSKEINFKYFKISLFELILTSTIISFLFLIIDAKPLFGWDNILVNNSADLLTLILTITMVISFLIWTKRIVLYNGKPVKLVNHLINKYNNYQGDNSETKKYLIRTINDFAYYSIKTQDTHLQEILVNFYWKEFNKQRNDYIKSLSSASDSKEKYEELLKKGVEYSADLYDLVYRVSLESNNHNNFLTRSIEYNSVSGWWLLGKGYEQVTTSELTYRMLWNILKLNLNKTKNIKSYWSKAHQYGNYAFRVDPQYDFGEILPLNQNEIELKNNERIRFLEFNYVLGGLLLQQKKYDVISYIFNYSSSTPPDYVLLPRSIDDVFYWFNRFSGRSNLRIEEIEVYYSFPDLDNFGVSHKVKYWICSYLCLLYIKQFSLHRYFSFQNHTGIPNLPEGKQELNKMLQNIPFFKKCLEDVITNEKVLSAVGLNDIVKEKRGEIDKHIIDVQESIQKKLNYTEEVKELSEEKKKAFRNNSKEIIKKALSGYKDILLNYDKKIIYDKNLKLVIKGSLNLMPKSAFVDDDIPFINFDKVLADSIVHNSIDRFIPSSFTVAATENYLVYKENTLNCFINYFQW